MKKLALGIVIVMLAGSAGAQQAAQCGSIAEFNGGIAVTVHPSCADYACSGGEPLSPDDPVRAGDPVILTAITAYPDCSFVFHWMYGDGRESGSTLNPSAVWVYAKPGSYVVTALIFSGGTVYTVSRILEVLPPARRRAAHSSEDSR